MDGEGKFILGLVVCIAFAVATVAVSVSWYHLTVTREAMQNGYEQKVVGNHTIWVKAGKQ
jgi:hypothetical protein